jgi:aryl-alcohol dehydrogenase-like predicted oxidoreductase
MKEPLNMQLRKLGELGPLVSSVGLGCMGMSEFYGTADDEASIKLIHEAVARGLNLFDSADMYGPFTNEELLGKALKGRRQQAVIATKFGFVRDDKGGYHGVSGRPEYIRAACEASLRRLQVEYIDLYYQHRLANRVLAVVARSRACTFRAMPRTRDRLCRL